MDPRERWEDREEALRVALEAWQRKLWTALPGIITGFDAADGTVTVQPSIMAQVIQPGAQQPVNQKLPLLIKCPVAGFGAGGFSITAPITAGDEVLVVFASRCIDSWWQSGGVQAQIELRLHDLSDGFAVLGVRSAARALGSWDTASLQIRSDDGETYWELTPAGQINAVAPTGVNITTPTLALTGNLTATGSIHAGFGTGDEVGLQTHEHPTATPGGPSPPTPGT